MFIKLQMPHATQGVDHGSSFICFEKLLLMLLGSPPLKASITVFPADRVWRTTILKSPQTSTSMTGRGGSCNVRQAGALCALSRKLEVSVRSRALVVEI